MGSTWLDMGPHSVRMKRTGSRKLSKCLPDLWDPLKTSKHFENPAKRTGGSNRGSNLRPLRSALFCRLALACRVGRHLSKSYTGAQKLIGQLEWRLQLQWLRMCTLLTV